MGSVLSYSGLSTKIRAMQSRLVTDEQLEEIVQLPNVPVAQTEKYVVYRFEG